jgi:hypothetical protein
MLQKVQCCAALPNYMTISFYFLPPSHLVDESPRHPDAFLDVSDDPVARLEARVVVQGGPDLRTDFLQNEIIQTS